MRRFLFWGCLSYLLIGCAHVIVGSLLPDLLEHYGKNYEDGGRLVALQFIGFLAGVLSGPWWSRRLGKRGALLLALGCLLAAETGYSVLPPWPVLLSFGPLAGFGFGMVEALIGALVIEHIEERKAEAMAKLEVFFGVGALAMPMLAGLLITAGWWHASFYFISFVTLIVFLAWAFLPFGSVNALLSQQHQSEKINIISEYRKNTGMLFIFILIFVLYVGIEMSIANFLPAMLIENAGVKASVGSYAVTCFWTVMVIGRIWAAQIAGRAGYSLYLLASCGGAVVLMAMFSFITGVSFSFVLIGLLGLCMSGMFAIALLFANQFFPKVIEQTTSLLIASGGLGGIMLPMLTGWSMDHLTVQKTVWILTGMTVLMFTLLVAVSRKKQSVTTTEIHKGKTSVDVLQG